MRLSQKLLVESLKSIRFDLSLMTGLLGKINKTDVLYEVSNDLRLKTSDFRLK